MLSCCTKFEIFNCTVNSYEYFHEQKLCAIRYSLIYLKDILHDTPYRSVQPILPT